MERTRKAYGRIDEGPRRTHAKASEQYQDVVFQYPDEGGAQWSGSVPTEYRRAGIHARTDAEVGELLQIAYEAMRPSRRTMWLEEQDQFWRARPNATVTKAFFDALKDCTWKCVRCGLPPNPNWARRVQDIKELGYVLATDTKRYCSRCGRNTTQLILLRMPRGGAPGYETWSPTLRDRILRVLENFDPYENSTHGRHLLPDHKFPEIRWDAQTPRENNDDMSDEDIQRKFQLLNNQRNQQKREVCRECYQTGKRGVIFGVSFFYEGGERWPTDVPRAGSAAERGCVGCGWYDIKRWRQALNNQLAKR